MDLLVSFSVVCPLKLFAAYPTGIGLRRLKVGFHVSSEVVLLCKLLAAFVTGKSHLKR